MIKVFIIDDSKLVINILSKILNKTNDIEVIGSALNPVDAFKEFKKVGLPDVFILDLEMPKMDGLTFLKKIQTQKPIPTIICSSYVSAGSTNAIKSLKYGACDIILKPKMNELENISEELISKVKAAANSKILNIHKNYTNKLKKAKFTTKIVGIGASTGGVQTLEEIFKDLLANHAPIVVVQHMPEGFTKSFAQSLDENCKNSTVKEAKDGDELKSGEILIAPGDKHLEITQKGLFKYQVVLKDGPKISGHKPSVDVMFNSMAKVCKKNCIAFILTGMGKDGAQGIKKIKEVGGITYAQDEKSSIVYGMPKVAFDIGGVDKQVSINEVAKIINELD